MRRTLLGLAVLAVGLVPSSFASIITHGTFSFVGTVYVTNTTGASPIVTPGGTCPAGGNACIFWQDFNSDPGSFIDISSSGLPSGDIPASIHGGSAGVISPLTNPPEIVDGMGFTPELFLSFLNGGVTTKLNIDYIAPGLYNSSQCGNPTPAVGQQCTTPGSLFNFVNNAGLNGPQATATWVFDGNTSDSSSVWTGNFTSQFGVPYQTVFAELATNGYATDTFSGVITLSLTPEPGTLGFIMIGCGLIGLGVGLRRLRTAK